MNLEIWFVLMVSIQWTQIAKAWENKMGYTRINVH